MKKLKIKFLSWLLFHANRFSRDKDFYDIKNKILAKFGKPVGYDLQEIAGKSCFHCHGSGRCQWMGYEECWYCGEYDDDECGKCYGSGWWKYPQRNVLLKLKFGQYVFHQPIQKLGEDEVCPYSLDSEIKGYVEHKPSRYGKLALYTLFSLYRPMKFKQIYEQNKLPF